MEYRVFGRTGRKLSALGLGTYYDPFWIFMAAIFRYRRHKDRSIEAIKTGLGEGVNLLDTAELYFTEEMVGEAIRGMKRDELFIATKVSYPYHFSYEGIKKACTASLKRLNTSYIDLYQLHMPFNLSRIKEIIRSMEELVDSGKIRYIGVSNFSLDQLKLAMDSCGKYEIVSNQVHYSYLHRNIEKDLLPFCEKENIAILAWYPLEHGKLTRVEAFPKEIIELYPNKTPAQIALKWLASRSELVFPIPRASNPAHVLENCKAFE